MARTVRPSGLDRSAISPDRRALAALGPEEVSVVLRGNVRAVIGTAVSVLLLTVLAGFHLAGRAGADETRCGAHRGQSTARAAAVTGTGARTLVIGDSWSVGLGLDELAGSWPSR